MKILVALVLMLALTPLAASAADVPYLSGRVVDDAEILKPATRGALADKLRDHEARTTNQVVVLTVHTIGGESIEEYATEVFEHWKLGQKTRDNGVLIIVVPYDRKMRIEVGYGLEGTLTDAQASRIIRNVMTPAFKAGDFDGGVSAGVDAVLTVLEGRGDAPADAPASAKTFEMLSIGNGRCQSPTPCTSLSTVATARPKPSPPAEEAHASSADRSSSSSSREGAVDAVTPRTSRRRSGRRRSAPRMPPTPSRNSRAARA